MPEDTKSTGHPLDQQNALERKIQLEGSKDPDNFKMPDGRTLSEVRRSNQELEDKEYQEEARMVARRAREQSASTLQKGKKLAITSTGNLLDTTEPVISERSKEVVTRSTSENVKPLREGTGNVTAPSGETATPAGTPTGGVTTTTPATTPTSTPASTGSPSTPATTPSSTSRT